MSKAAELANLIGNINAGGGGANKNVIINGDFKLKQRAGTGTQSTDLGASNGYHLHDRWKAEFDSTAGRLTMSHDSSAPSGFANSMKLACTTADTSIAAGELFIFQQRLEGQNLQAFAKGTSDAKPFAVSFYVKGNASATYVAELFDQDNTRHVAKTFSVTTDWTRVELSFPADTTGAFDDDNARSLDLNIWLHAGSTYSSGTLPATWASNTSANRAAGISSFFDSTSRTFFLTGVQLEVGQNPTDFEHINNFGEELARCQRYFQRYPFISETTSGLIAHQYSATVAYGGFRFKRVMRVEPTMSLTNNASDFTAYNGSGRTVSAISSDGMHVDGCSMAFTTSSATLGNALAVNGNANAGFNFDSEL
jgi:hypothetical protein